MIGYRPPGDRTRLSREGVSARNHPHPDEDQFSTLVIRQTTTQSAESMKRCNVCDRLTVGTHYGAAVCGSCASFFRRTIGNGKAYQCTCRMPYRNKKKGCRHCRFSSCLKAGMDAKVVQAIKSFPQPNDTLLSRLLSCRNRVYISRGLLLRQTDAERRENPRWCVPDGRGRSVVVVYGSLKEFLPELLAICAWPIFEIRCVALHRQIVYFAFDLGLGRSFEYLCNVEYHGLTQYWADFLRCFPHFKDGASPTLLTKHFLAIWLKLEQILATVTHGRIDKEVALSDYETIIPATYDWFYAFCCRYSAKWTSDPSVLAALAVENASEVLHISRIVHRASLDNLEVTTLIQFLIAYYEREMFVDDASVKKFVNQVLRDLHDHYKSTYHNYHERLGVLTSTVGEIHRVISLNKQFSMQLSLYTKSGQGMQFPSLEEPVNTLHDLRRSVRM